MLQLPDLLDAVTIAAAAHQRDLDVTPLERYEVTPSYDGSSSLARRHCPRLASTQRCVIASGTELASADLSDVAIHLAELPEATYGRDIWRQNAEVMRRVFPDIRTHTEDIVAAEDRVAVPQGRAQRADIVAVGTGPGPSAPSVVCG